MKVLLICKEMIAYERLAIMILGATLKKEGHEVRAAVMNTSGAANGRSDYPNQVREPEMNTYHNILSENNVRGLAFACLVRKIDGEPMEDFSVDNLKTILEKFSSWGLEIGHVKNKTTDVKKN